MASFLRAHRILLLLTEYLIHISSKALIEHLRGTLLTLRRCRVLRDRPDLLRHERIAWRSNGLIHTLSVEPRSLLHVLLHSLLAEKEDDGVRVLHLKKLPVLGGDVLHAVSNGVHSISGRVLGQLRRYLIDNRVLLGCKMMLRHLGMRILGHLWHVHLWVAHLHAVLGLLHQLLLHHHCRDLHLLLHLRTAKSLLKLSLTLVWHHALHLHLLLGHVHQGRLGILQVLLQTGGLPGSGLRDVGKLFLARSVVGILIRATLEHF